MFASGAKVVKGSNAAAFHPGECSRLLATNLWRKNLSTGNWECLAGGWCAIFDTWAAIFDVAAKIVLSSPPDLSSAYSQPPSRTSSYT